ncbi:MAG TPA: lysophospholipid acyltransferase family protein [Streptosporangiaceae bacterium]|nr:lysophospholipid acyltransferase family protein [Streptosporangiaceae bacterium]
MSRQERSHSPGWRIFAGRTLQLLLHALMKHEQRGRENVPREGGVILAPNHLSYADWGAVAICSYESGRFPVFLIKSSVFNVKVVGPFLRVLGQLPVYRNRGDAALVLKAAEAALRDNQCLIVYPEGTASRDPGLWPMVAKTGAARLALKTGVPVIPIAQWGAHEVLPYGSTRPHLFPRKRARLVAGPPVDLSAFKGKPLTATTLRAATAVIMADVTSLLAGLRNETPPAVPFDPAAASRPSSIGRTDADPVTADAAAGSPPGDPEIAAGVPADGAETADGPETEARPT